MGVEPPAKTMSTEESEAQFAGIWDEALKQYAQVTNKRLEDANMPKPTSAANLLQEIESQQAKFSDFRGKRHMLFTVLGGAMKPIELVGNLAAGGASMAFPPSSLVFGAVTYLIDAGHGVSQSYDAIIDLFTEVKDFTTRLSVHARENISQELREIVTQVLVTLINICGMSAKLISHGRFGQYVKGVLLGRDEKVEGELGKLRRLTESEERMVGALTLSEVSRTGKVTDGVAVVVSDVQISVNDIRDQMSHLVLTLNESKKQDKDDSERKLLEKIRLALNPSTTPQDIYNGITSKRVAGTGDWIRDEPYFKAWVEREKPILWLSGGPGAGKSYLSSNIIQYLTQLHPQGVQDPSRISVAYYFCKDYDPELRSFNKALRSIAYEICQNDPVFAKHVGGLASFPDDLRSTQALWKKVFVDFFRADSFENMVYVLVDGLDEALEEERRDFLELLKDFEDQANEDGKLRMQVIIIGRPELNYDIEEVLDDPIPMITVSAKKNSEDINTYVKQSITKIKILRRVSKQLRDEIVTSLTAGAEGMFLYVDLLLKEIATKHREEQIRLALKEAPRGLLDTIRHVLERFSNELTEDDANDLNELLAWVTCAKRPFTLGELDTVMKMKSSDGQGMIYLEGELRKRYASFFTLIRDDGRTTEDFQADHKHKGEFDNEEEGADDRGNEHVDNDPGMDDDFGEEMGIVSDPATTDVTLAHASIGDYFRKEAKGTISVGVDFNEAQLNIVKRFLSIICDDELWKKWAPNSLILYAVYYWQDHLEGVNLSATSPADKQYIGDILIKMFRDEKMIMRWAGSSGSLRQDWIYTDTSIDVVHKWFHDTDATKNYSEADKKWVDALYPNSDDDALKPATMIAAREWLQKFPWKPEQCFLWLNAYIQKAKSRKDKTDPPKQDPTLIEVPASTIREVARWPGFEENSHWHTRVAKALREAERFEEATEEFETAWKMDEKNWLAGTGLAITYSKQYEYEKAIETMEKALDVMKSDPETMKSYKSWFDSDTKMIAQWNEELGNTDKALEAYQQVFHLWPRDYECAMKILELLHEEEKYPEIMTILEEMKKDIVPQFGVSRLTEICQKFHSDDDSFYDVTVRAGRETGKLDFIKDMYKTASKAAKKNAKLGVAGLLDYWYGLLIQRHYRDNDKAARIWERVMEASSSTNTATELGYARVLSAMKLCLIYFDKAMSAEKGSPKAEASIKKLENLSKQKADKTNEASPWLYSTRDSTLILGLWYRLNGKENEARECFKSHVKLAIDLLTDDDISNDWQGYQKLADTLLYAGDDANTLTAYSLLGVPEGSDDEDDDEDDDEEEGKAGEDAEQAEKVENSVTNGVTKAKAQDGEVEGEKKDEKTEGEKTAHGEDGAEASSTSSDDSEEGLMTMTCDGPCERFFSKPDDFNVCRYCINVGFCGSCVELVKKDEMPYAVCSSKHDFLHIPKAEEKMKKGIAKVGGKDVPVQEWLDGLRKEWAV